MHNAQRALVVRSQPSARGCRHQQRHPIRSGQTGVGRQTRGGPKGGGSITLAPAAAVPVESARAGNSKTLRFTSLPTTDSTKSRRASCDRFGRCSESPEPRSADRASTAYPATVPNRQPRLAVHRHTVTPSRLATESRSASSTTASRSASVSRFHAAANRARRVSPVDSSAGFRRVPLAIASEFTSPRDETACFLGEFAGCSPPCGGTRLVSEAEKPAGMRVFSFLHGLDSTGLFQFRSANCLWLSVGSHEAFQEPNASTQVRGGAERIRRAAWRDEGFTQRTSATKGPGLVSRRRESSGTARR